MANTPTIKDSEQSILGSSFDPDFGVINVGQLTYNSLTETMDKVFAIQGNATHSYTYTDNKLTKITKIIGDTSYEKTFTYSGDNLTGDSEWVKV